MEQNKKVLISPSSFGQCGLEPLEILKENGFEVIINQYGRKLTEDEVIDLGHEVVGIVAGVEPLTKRVIQNLPKLKCISRVGVGLDSIDVEFAQSQGIKIVNTPDGPTRAVAELTVALTMDLLRKISVANFNIKRGVWKKEIGNLIFDKVIGIIGFGRIGRETSRLFQGLGAKVIAYDKYPNYELSNKLNIPLVDEKELFSSADIITVHVPGNKDKSPVITNNELKLMKPDAYLVNVSRGGVVAEKDLYW